MAGNIEAAHHGFLADVFFPARSRESMRLMVLHPGYGTNHHTSEFLCVET
ncbi:hypothetical protein [Mesorhizobium loti]|nr:hypothetical protein [Mesorhizobium loti]